MYKNITNIKLILCQNQNNPLLSTKMKTHAPNRGIHVLLKAACLEASLSRHATRRYPIVLKDRHFYSIKVYSRSSNEAESRGEETSEASSKRKQQVAGSRSTPPATSSRRRSQQQQSRPGRPPSRAPKNGFFSDVDPNATVYPVRGSLKQDPTKRGGRWESDFVWNSNWKEAMEYNDQLMEKKNQKNQIGGDGDDSGKYAATNTTKVDLNDMNVDLTEALLAPSKSVLDKSRASNVPSIPIIVTKNKKQQVNNGKDQTLQKMTQRETRAWGRSARYASKPVAQTNSSQDDINDEDEEGVEYDTMKRELQVWTIGLTAVCFACTVFFYGKDVGASYGVGALGGLLYLRSLTRSVDSFGNSLGGAGSPRLLIPVILALGYNRYNTMIASQSDVAIHLQLLPMLVGFFTYKGAVIGKQGLDLLDELFDKK